MEKIYNKLNDYLNEICKYLEKTEPFLLEYIEKIAILNDDFLDFINKYTFQNQTHQNFLTFEEVYDLTRKIIKQIDEKYLIDFDNLIQSGELDFSYEGEYDDSHCISFYKKEKCIKQIINIDRCFNYDDVRRLVHEFMHYTNGKYTSKNRKHFTEFISIYFEMFAIDYLLDININKEELDYWRRLKNIKSQAWVLNKYEMVLLAYTKFGNLNNNTIDDLQKYVCNMSKEAFEKECYNFCKNLVKTEKKYQEELSISPNTLGEVLSEKLVLVYYKYVFSFFSSILARFYMTKEQVVYFNNHMYEIEEMNIADFLKLMGIDIENKNFSKVLFEAIEYYISEIKLKTKDSFVNKI